MFTSNLPKRYAAAPETKQEIYWNILPLVMCVTIERILRGPPSHSCSNYCTVPCVVHEPRMITLIRTALCLISYAQRSNSISNLLFLMCIRRRGFNNQERDPDHMMATVNDGSKGAKIAQLVHWDGALAAARRRAYRPSPEDVRIPWAHGSTRRTAHTEVCTPTPFPALNRITLFLRTSMSSLAIAHKISTDFFGGRQLTVKVCGDRVFKYAD